jgi:hypothetical protein
MNATRVLVVLALLVCAFAAGVTLSAQVASRPVPPKVLAGPDVGFRVTALSGRTAIGQIVVRINGDWVNAQLGGVGARPAN